MNINHHFRNEHKVLLWLIVAPFVIGFIVIILAPIFMEESDIDSCLDKGGSFNYERCECDLLKTHPIKESHSCNGII